MRSLNKNITCSKIGIPSISQYILCQVSQHMDDKEIMGCLYRKKHIISHKQTAMMSDLKLNSQKRILVMNGQFVKMWVQFKLGIVIN